MYQKKRGRVTAACIIVLCAIGIWIYLISLSGSRSETAEDTGTILIPADEKAPSAERDSCQNLTRKTWTAPNGETFTIGLGHDPAEDRYIYLNVQCHSAAKEDGEVGYYLKSDRGLLEYSEETEVLTDCDAGSHADQANFLIPRRFYHKVAAMEYTNAQRYGVRWSDDHNDGTVGGTTIHVRAVRLKTAEFLAVFDIMIAWDQTKKRYLIQEVHGADVREYGWLTETERERAVQLAIAFASETMIPGEGWQTAARTGAIVHKTNRPYFPRFLDTEQKTAQAVQYWSCQDTFAVTFPVSYYGYGTVYLAPRTECIGLTEPKLYGRADWDLQVYGYDPLNPRDETTIAAPIDFFSY